MANESYVKTREAAWSGEIDLLTSDIRFAVVDADSYTADIDNDEFLSDVPTEAIQGTSDLLTGKNITGGYFSASGVSFSDAPGSPESPVVAELLIGYIDTADPATSRLLGKIDSGSNLPITLNGSVITAIFPNGKIFNL